MIYKDCSLTFFSFCHRQNDFFFSLLAIHCLAIGMCVQVRGRYGGMRMSVCIPQVGSFFHFLFIKSGNLLTPQRIDVSRVPLHFWILSVQMMMQSLINGSFQMLWPVHISNGVYAFCYYRHQTDLITSLLSFLLFGCLAYVNIRRFYDFYIISISDFLLKL